LINLLLLIELLRKMDQYVGFSGVPIVGAFAKVICQARLVCRFNQAFTITKQFLLIPVVTAFQVSFDGFTFFGHLWVQFVGQELKLDFDLVVQLLERRFDVTVSDRAP